MAENAEIIKEFLVSLGFKVDAKTFAVFEQAVGKTTAQAIKFAGVLGTVAFTATAFVDKVSSKLEDLYWSSARLRDGAANIQDFQLEISKVGGSADGALSSLENMAKYLRTNPAAEGLLHNLGVQTRDVHNNLRSTIAIVRDFAKIPQPYWLKFKFAERFGIDEKTLQAIMRSAPEARDRIADLYKTAGLSADQAAQGAHDFQNRLRDTEATAGVLATVLEVRLVPVATAFLNALTWISEKLLTLDKWTKGLSTDFLTLTAILIGINFAMKLAFGTSIAQMLAGLILNIGLLVEALGASEGVVGALAAVSAAIEATPIGWIATAIAAVALVALYVINHWDKVKQYFNSFVGWLKDKYNAVAKYLGLPKWEGEGQGGPGGAEPAKPYRVGQPWSPAEQSQAAPVPAGTSGPGRNFPEEERGWSARSPAGGAPQATTNKALAFFQRAGWTAAQAAGIVANLMAESGLDSHAVGDHGEAYGAAQWHKDRQEAFAKMFGHSIQASNLDEQLAFVQAELEGKTGDKGAAQAGKLLKSLNSAAAAGAAISKYYERPADVMGQMAARGKGAAALMSGAGKTTVVTLNAKTDIQVNGSGDSQATARAVGRDQGRVNGNLLRNFAGAVDATT